MAEDTGAKSALYPGRTIAGLFNISERRVQQLAKRNIIPKEQHGKYDLVECVRAYVTYLQERAFGRGAPDSDDMELAKLKLIKARAEEKSIAVDAKSGALIPVDEVVLLGQAIVASFRSRVLYAHSKLRNRFPEMSQELSDGINDELRAALEELGSSGLHPEIGERIRRHNAKVQASSTASD